MRTWRPKYSFKCSFAALAITTALSGGVSPAYGDNVSVETAIRDRSDLSMFYEALINTGVNHELQEGKSYTIFAPTNEAFQRISQRQYPCFYMTECRAQVAAIVRDHIVPGTVYADDAVHQRGGVYTLGGRFIAAGPTGGGDFAVAGNDVVYMSAFSSGILYKINGIIVDPHDLDALAAGDAGYPVAANAVTTTTSQNVINDPACPGGCPDKTETVVTRTVVDPNPALSPAR